MKFGSAVLKMGALAVALSQLVGCQTIVQKPEVNEVKRVAIVSLYANDKVARADGRGLVKDWPNDMKIQIADEALRIFSREFQSIGWEVVNPDAVIQSEAYQSAFKVEGVKPDSTLGMLANMAQDAYARSFFTPAGMLPIVLNDKEVRTTHMGNVASERDVKAKLANMAKTLKVDAVALVQLDYCYKGGTWSLGGTGAAVMTAKSSIKAVNQKGDVVVKMQDLRECDEEDRSVSTSTTGMIEGNLIFPKSFTKGGLRDMFIEATGASAKVSMENLQKALK
ncbi:MAG TPA: hypothetical protein VE954_18650 [Oligoflexus sp.]|uniref:hypothetical protein n=1 Tax=Oligoflexus sp. TaxID=1971216 RepID=UPI002D49D13A|nr:hypothetical protein [Oligoflexus sp.]HYX35121.1 hypothetical protein [Oligoflexus sp.]